MLEVAFVTVTVPFLAVFTAVMGLFLWREAGRPGRVRLPQVAIALIDGDQALRRWVPDDTCPDWIIRLALASCTVRARVRRIATGTRHQVEALRHAGGFRPFLSVLVGVIYVAAVVALGAPWLLGLVVGLGLLYLVSYALWILNPASTPEAMPYAPQHAQARD